MRSISSFVIFTMAVSAPLLIGQAGATKQNTPAPAASKPPATGATGSAPARTLQTRPSPVKAATPTELSPQEAASRIAQAHALWGPEMGNSALASISLQEIARNGAVYTYHLYAVGMPREMLYNIVAWPVNQPQPVQVVAGVALDATGMAICPGQLGTCGNINNPNLPTNLSITIAPGRPVRVGLVAQDDSLRAYTKIVPVPIRGEENGCTVEAVMLTPNGTIAVIEGSGFAPNSAIEMRLENGDTPTSGKSTVDEAGTFKATVIPIDLAKTGTQFGTMKVSVTSEKCKPALSFDWGTKPAPSLGMPQAPEKKQ
jgi:hypothetical protein